MMKNSIKKAAAVSGALLMAFSGVACGGKPETGEGTLDIYVHKAGYGVQWAYDLKDAFMQEDWVKAKYSNLNVIVTDGDQDGYVKSKLVAPNNNHYDLMLGFDSDYPKDNSLLEDLYDDVYNQVIPGEGTTKYIDRYFDSYATMNKYVDPNDTSGKDKYYVTAWAGGMNGIFYNEDLLTAMGYSVPRTTNELLAICNAIYEDRTDGVAETNDVYEGYSFIQSSGLAYLTYVMPIWWAQYDGIQGYNDFYNGVYDNKLSKSIFSEYKGRLYSLEVFEDLFGYGEDKIVGNTTYVGKHLNPQSMSADYTYKIAQGLFLRGQGVFHVNGDWFEQEMKEKKAEIKQMEGIDYSIKMMRMPIISKLGEKLGITDSELAAIVDYVDGTTTTAPTFTSTLGYDSDLIIETVREARGVVHSIGAQHMSYVPSYAREKDIAKDFLLFMATDKAQDIYMQATGGCSLPFKYDVKTENPDVYAALTDMQKARIDYFNSDTVTVYTLPAPESFPLVKVGGLRAFSINDYHTVLTMKDTKKSAQTIFDDTIADWHDQKWSDACSKANVQ